ncbi:MAG: AAA domain-containing protein [Terracoccus sp.]
MRSGVEQQAVLGYWRMVELFSPQRLPKVSRSQDRVKVVDWQPGGSLPWETLPEPKKGRVWQHTAYLGLYELSHVYELLHQVFVDDRDAYDPRPSGRSACAGIVIDASGQLMSDCVVLSSCAWALGRAHRPGLRSKTWMNGFEQAQASLSEAVATSEASRQEEAGTEQPPAHDGDSLSSLLETAREHAGLALVPGLRCQGVRIRSLQVSAKAAGEPVEFDFLNSFHLEDLATVAAATKSGQVGAALSTYLTPESSLDIPGRINVRDEPDVVTKGTVAERIPPGRWPAAAQNALALSQQFAVNEALSLTGSAGLLGVNGPPGTGKTTLLRDLIAGNIVERARRLSELERPQLAFGPETHCWNSIDGRDRSVPALRSDLAGFEMVVASNSNAAVENVTADIPAQGAIDAPWQRNVDHFTGLASAILRTGSDAVEEEAMSADVDEGGPHDSLARESEGNSQQAWALVAATLGNKKNRAGFVSAFWFAEGEPEDDYAGKGMMRLLQASRSTRVQPWHQSRAAFQRAWDTVDELRARCITAEQRLRRRPEVRARLDELSHEVADAETAAQVAERASRAHEPSESRAEEAGVLARTKQELHLRAKPGLLEIVLSWGHAGHLWRERHLELDAELTVAQDTLRKVRQCADELRDDAQNAHGRLTALEVELADLEAERDHLATQCARDEAIYGRRYPGNEWVDDARELTTPWLTAELNSARTELFVAALRLHRDFVLDQAADMERWLRASVEVVNGTCPRQLAEHKRLAAWQLFFLVVPVVSTTLASMSRMFTGVRAEGLGWLFIDEAGQCAPQQAVGAIWRARRVLAVGDPMQLPPVVTIPAKALRDIAKSYKVGPTWIPPGASVQTLADRVGRLGTYLPTQEGTVWVSTPLRVHRRCDQPMFGISDQIGYGGLMVNAVNRAPDADDPFLPGESGTARVAESYWADTPADTHGTHLQRGQIERLEKAIAYVHGCGVSYAEMFALSPFRAVADELERVAGEHRGMRGGTIHTAQGRQADVVFLVLGGESTSLGARQWASSPPNLLNVAVSRAKRRLYVIGSHDDWSTLPSFTLLAKRLPRR